MICSICFKLITQDNYISQDLCKICDIVLKGGTRQCNICNEIKDVIYFERTYLKTCFQCYDKIFKYRFRYR